MDNYFTNHFLTKNHRSIRRTYLVPTDGSINHICYYVPSDMGDCVESIPTRGIDDGRTRSPPHTNGQSIYGYKHSNRYRRKVCI